MTALLSLIWRFLCVALFFHIRENNLDRACVVASEVRRIYNFTVGGISAIPESLAVDTADNLYMSSYYAFPSRIYKLKYDDSALLAAYNTVQSSTVAVDSDNNIVWSNATAIVKVANNGTLLATYNLTTDTPDLCVDKEGHVYYVNDDVIIKLTDDMNGTVVRYNFTCTPACKDLRYVTVDRNGNVYGLTHWYTSVFIKFAPDGKVLFQQQIKWDPSFGLSLPVGLTVDCDGFFYISIYETTSRKIWNYVLKLNDKWQEVYRFYMDDQWGMLPSRVTLNSYNDVLVSDQSSRRVIAFVNNATRTCKQSTEY